MDNDAFHFDQASFLTHEALRRTGSTLKRSQVAELIAAALGYRTYAALATENSNLQLEFHLADAEHVVLSSDAALERFKVLFPDSADDAARQVAVLMETITAAFPHTYDGVDGLWEDFLEEHLAQMINDADETSSAQAESNAIFPYGVEMDAGVPPADALWSSETEWVITGHGVLSGEYDPDADRMYTGDRIHCSAAATFSKAGRGGLILSSVDVGAGTADEPEWREFDDGDGDTPAA